MRCAWLVGRAEYVRACMGMGACAETEKKRAIACFITCAPTSVHYVHGVQVPQRQRHVQQNHVHALR